MRGAPFLALTFALGAASLPLRGEEPVATAGKQRAGRAGVEWDVRDVEHPQLGPIRFAVQRNAVATIVDGRKILSQTYVSCQKGAGRIALELTNASAEDLAGGLPPADLPRLVCSSPGPAGARKPVKREIAAKWEIGPLGDTLARGLAPSELRRCASISVRQSVVMPPGTSRASERITVEIPPHHPALDAVFAACGGMAAPGPGEGAPAAAAWQGARTTTKGRTIVRAAAGLDSAIVSWLDPGTRLLAQRASAPWWKVKPRSGAAFEGYIREDRLSFE